jgi:hypothetical protein
MAGEACWDAGLPCARLWQRAVKGEAHGESSARRTDCFASRCRIGSHRLITTASHRRASAPDYASSPADDTGGADRHAFSSDRHALGSDRHALGSDRHALGSDRHALGSDRHALGSDRHAFGSDQHAFGSDQHALGAIAATTATDERAATAVTTTTDGRAAATITARERAITCNVTHSSGQGSRRSHTQDRRWQWVVVGRSGAGGVAHRSYRGAAHHWSAHPDLTQSATRR